ncbi:MAG: ThiF family adenylyltransferase [Bacteroidota bacterium]|nr:ThiF family adenylyltransferase [Bacteroidota bacterium]
MVDGCDNFETRFLINDVCEFINKPWVFGSVEGWCGQVSLCNVAREAVISGNYCDIYPEAPFPGEAPTCDEIGVVGSIPMIIGNLQANEVIKFLTGSTGLLINQLLLMDLLHCSFQIIRYDRSSRLSQKSIVVNNYEIDPQSAKELIANGDATLIDIRQEYEFDIENSGGTNIPYQELVNSMQNLDNTKTVILVCEKGLQSREMARYLRKKNYANIYSLSRGFRTIR